MLVINLLAMNTAGERHQCGWEKIALFVKGVQKKALRPSRFAGASRWLTTKEEAREKGASQ